MRRTLMAIAVSLLPTAAFAASTGTGSNGQARLAPGFACDMRALTTAQRAEHAQLARDLVAAVKARRELPNGYAFRFAADRWLPTARWAELERRCCPFFAFELASAADGGAVWLRITGRPGVKGFLKSELGF
jgi:hypothetical protein